MSNTLLRRAGRALVAPLALLLAFAVATPAWAGVRPMPLAAKRAVMQPPHNGTVQMGNTVYPLSAALQIRDGQNRIVMSGSVTQPVLVRFTTDSYGNVTRVWILTAEEAAQPEQLVAPPPAIDPPAAAR